MVKWQLTVNFPKFGFCFPAKIFNAVDFPIPLVPTNPSTSPGRGMGSLNKYSIKQLLYACIRKGRKVTNDWEDMILYSLHTKLNCDREDLQV